MILKGLDIIGGINLITLKDVKEYPELPNRIVFEHRKTELKFAWPNLGNLSGADSGISYDITNRTIKLMSGNTEPGTYQVNLPIDRIVTVVIPAFEGDQGVPDLPDTVTFNDINDSQEFFIGNNLNARINSSYNNGSGFGYTTNGNGILTITSGNTTGSFQLQVPDGFHGTKTITVTIGTNHAQEDEEIQDTPNPFDDIPDTVDIPVGGEVTYDLSSSYGSLQYSDIDFNVNNK